ncbi:serine/threonine-protein kinase, transcription and stress response, putative [Candida dubliniensis CD36]|uniref:non-specific serine/threonine protein kinase n=1 Tax=Candida dubliniensis (strain CD36 / ATCC MYA-646 / CBS 7987 / NCPF 3949 / NRRL Y-17841) TaxID=573826 RepID=B9WBV6_CANDC|nr:serine/threonine-protein kinase, transcription and stress response, putative [Candida dubliniensis CD36]CAX43878.1 serine/threonine-protein kinase, transcription and stress response, putative [Candida dubliniensis CD36]
MTSFFNRSPKHQSHHYQQQQQQQQHQDVTDISYSMENVSISSNAMMDIDTSYRSSKPTFNNPPQQQQVQNNLFNKENITPLNSPTKSILHNSPQTKSSTSPQHLYNKLVNANYNGNSPQPPSHQQQQQNNNRALQNNINQLQPPLNKRYKLTEEEFYSKANSARTKRLTSIAQLYFLDYYCDMFDYVINRRERTCIVEKNLLTDPIYKNDIIKQQFEWKNYIGRERALLRKRRLKPKHKDFEMITQIGQGGYGQVFLSRKRDTREICALKILNKKLLIKLDETRHVLTERDILTNTRSDWLVKLLYAFQDHEKVFLAMEFVPGGDFRTLLNNTGYLIPPHARFYISEMFAAVNSLHELGFTHRDLKPENFLIDSKGHIKLTDFGLAAGTVCNDRIESMKIKLQNLQNLNDFNEPNSNSNSNDNGYQVPSSLIYERQKIFKQSQQQQQNSNNTTANSIVGSPDYMALEVLEGKNYNYTIDYWSLGCMLFEALCGYPPFSGSKQDETYYNLKHWKTCLRRPQTKDGRYVFSDRTWNLIIKLIASPNNRLQNFKQVQQQNYFNDIKDWNNLRLKTPPFTPQLDNEEDAGYFDDFEDDEMMMKYKDVFARQEQNEQLLEKSNNNNEGITTINTKFGKRFNGSKFNDNFIGFTFKHKSNPNNKFTNGNTNRYANNNNNNNNNNYNNNNGEINLLNMVENGNSRSSRLNPLATLY